MPGAAAVAIPLTGATDPLNQARLNQFEPVTKLAVQFTVVVGSPALRISMLLVMEEPPFWRAWKKTPVWFTASSGPPAATNTDTGISTLPADEAS